MTDWHFIFDILDKSNLPIRYHLDHVSFGKINKFMKAAEQRLSNTRKAEETVQQLSRSQNLYPVSANSRLNSKA